MLRKLASRLDPRTPVVDRESDDEDAPQGGLGGSERDNKPSVRERLDALSDFRIRSRAIKFTSGESGGSGGKGDVVKASWVKRWYSNEEEAVAVKKIRNVTTERARSGFAHEVVLMSKISHENIVKFIGFVEDLEHGTAWIVMSWESNGNISEFLANGSYEIVERVSLIEDTFKGIKYLHTRRPPICHGDLKSLNILVSSSYRAVITDFGSAREISDPEIETMSDESGQPPTTGQACPPIHVAATGNKLTLTGPAWSLRWASPEVVYGKRPSLSSDIWAAGWVCWEVMTNRLPFHELNSEGLITLATINGEVPSPREDEQLGRIMVLCTLMTDCWAFDPKSRPSVTQCCNQLRLMPATPPSGGKQPSSKEQSVEILMQNSHMYYQQSDYKTAASLLQQALSLAESAGNQQVTAQALMQLGFIYRDQDKFIEAEESFQRAKNLYARIGDVRGRADLTQDLGNVYLFQSKYRQAEELFTQAQELYSQMGNKSGLASVFTGLGEVYRRQSKYTLAEKALARAENIYADIGSGAGRGAVLMVLGYVYYHQCKYAGAEQSFRRAQEFNAGTGDKLRQANSLCNLGHFYRFRSNYAQAEESYIRAEELYASFGEDHGRANTLEGMGDLRRSQGRTVEAASCYSEARDLHVKMGRAKDAEAISRTLAALSPDPKPSGSSPQGSVRPYPLSTNISP